GGRAREAEASWCPGYVLGFTAGQTAEHINSTLPAPMLCPPAQWPPAWQLSRSLVTWLRAHPTDLHLDHSTIMLLAYASVFPCSVDDLNAAQLPPPAVVMQRLPPPKAGKGKP